MKLRFSKGQKTILKYVIVFSIGFLFACFLSLQGWSLCCQDACPLDAQDQCSLTCLLIHTEDEVGNPVSDVSIAIYWSNGTLITGGITDVNGNYLVNRDLFGCGGEGLTLNWTFGGLQGTVVGSGDFSNNEADCFRESTYGCCSVTIIVK